MNKFLIIPILIILITTKISSQSFDSNVVIEKTWPALSLINTSTDYNSYTALQFKANEVPTENYFRISADKNASGNAGFLNLQIVKKNTTINSGDLTYLLFQDDNNNIRFNPSNTFTSGEAYGNILFENGKVGIGALVPETHLHVKAPGWVYVRIEGGENSASILELSNTNKTWQLQTESNEYFTIRDKTNNAKRLTINNEGEVGIGTTSPDTKLAVNGTIHTKEVKVDLIGWSDFVFDKEYELRTLEEVEQHITEKGHLPEIPNEEEVTKNGINLGEMDAKLLQKIEELTLYLIEQNKKNQAQQAEIDKLKQMNIELLKKLENK